MKCRLATFMVMILVAGCSGEQKPTDLVTFDLRGVVVSINYQQRRIIIDHEEIPNYMMAMTMPFKVKDTSILYRVQPGDTVQGTLAVSRSESWIEKLAVVSKGEVVEPSSAAADSIFRRVYKVGETMPDFSFVNQEGRRVRLSDYRGKVVAMTFIYTRCPLPDFCIRMSDHFARVQKSLSADRTLAGKWHLMTISFDPKFDTPPVLKNYGKVYTKDLSTWDFVTDSMKTILDIADGLELVTEDDEGGLIAHNLRTAVIDKKGALVEVFRGNEWTPQQLKQAMADAIHEN
ncbi:MAG TPA: SCO family protein [Bacteroidota bacterium]|nr:SCO family protein [Bacteroidota bacterium]